MSKETFLEQMEQDFQERQEILERDLAVYENLLSKHKK